MGRTRESKAAGLHLVFDYGVDDFLIETNRDLHRRLAENQSPHDYIERPGGHTWAYWQNALPYRVLLFGKGLRASGVTVP